MATAKAQDLFDKYPWITFIEYFNMNRNNFDAGNMIRIGISCKRVIKRFCSLPTFLASNKCLTSNKSSARNSIHPILSKPNDMAEFSFILTFHCTSQIQKG